MLKIVAIVCFCLLPVQALSATCSELASQFAKDPNSLSAEDLSALKRCVDQKLREKRGMKAPPAPPEGAPALPQGKERSKLPPPPK